MLKWRTMKVLITGSNGLVGQKLLDVYANQPECEVLATSLHDCQIPGLPPHMRFQPLDITQKSQVRTWIQKFRPDCILHGAALTSVDPQEKNRAGCWDTNVEGTRHLLDAAEEIRSHFIFLSTDFIFDGLKDRYKEDDIPNPVNFYGHSKLHAEYLVRQSRLPWTILRTILVYGFCAHLPRLNIVTLVKSKLEAGETLSVVTDQWRMPTLAEDLAGACQIVQKKKARGIFHISGSELISIYDLAVKIAEIFNLDSSKIKPVTTAQLKEPAKRPLKTGFVLTKAQQELGYRSRSLQDGLMLVRQQMLSYNLPLCKKS